MKKLLNTLKDWRYWHHHVKYIPLTPVWIWYCIKSGTPWFFTASNPTLTFGGFEGEGKEEMYNQLPDETYPSTIYIDPDLSEQELIKTINQSQLQYPFAVKPNVGMMGFMFRKISSEEQLLKYHKAIGVKYLVQTLVTYPQELSVFYYRMPANKKGKISGFIQKEPPFIVGDGSTNIETLIRDHYNPFLKTDKLLEKFTTELSRIPAANEKIYLSNASNRTQGGSFVDLSDEIDESLQSFFDNISNDNRNFYYGRYDILCTNVADLKVNKNYSILEFNGAGAGTQHIFTRKYNFWQSEREVLHHWKKLYQISRYNRQHGERKWGLWEGWRHLKAAKKNLMYLLRKDAEFPVF